MKFIKSDVFTESHDKQPKQETQARNRPKHETYIITNHQPEQDTDPRKLQIQAQAQAFLTLVHFHFGLTIVSDG